MSFLPCLFHCSLPGAVIPSFSQFFSCLYSPVLRVLPALFLSLFSLILFFVLLHSARARPPILLTNAWNPSVPPVHRNPPFLLYSVGGTSPFPFFLLFVLTRTSPPLSAFIGLRCPAAAIAASGSLTFTSGDKYGFVWDIPGFQRRRVFDSDPPSYDRDLFGADPSERAMSHK